MQELDLRLLRSRLHKSYVAEDEAKLEVAVDSFIHSAYPDIDYLGWQEDYDSASDESVILVEPYRDMVMFATEWSSRKYDYINFLHNSYFNLFACKGRMHLLDAMGNFMWKKERNSLAQMDFVNVIGAVSLADDIQGYLSLRYIHDCYPDKKSLLEMAHIFDYYRYGVGLCDFTMEIPPGNAGRRMRDFFSEKDNY